MTTEAGDPTSQEPTRPGFVEQVLRKTGFRQTHEVFNLEGLYRREAAQLDDVDDEDEVGRFRPATGVGGDEWIAETPYDRFGLALSGGGIRSATFNLGLLQGLARFRVLEHVSYLATVSGGGYVGGFWIAWLARHERTGPYHFPLGSDRRGGERAEIRHLREFSRFLLPRLGVRETELWSAVMTVLGGLLPSIVAALALLVVAWSAWLLALAAVGRPGAVGLATIAGLLLVFFVATESIWRRSEKSEDNRIERVGYVCATALALVSISLLWSPWGRALLASVGGLETQDPLLWSTPGAFQPAGVLGVSFLGLLVARTVIARFARNSDGVAFLVGVERGTSRTLAFTIAATGFATFWVVSAWIVQLVSDSPTSRIELTAGTAGLAGLFAWLSRWLREPVQETRASKLLDRVLRWLRQATPRVLAYLVLALVLLLVGSALRSVIEPAAPTTAAPLVWPAFWWASGGALAVLGITMFLFDPARVGLHEFYRSRISRCYLGASNETAARADNEPERVRENRHVAERPGDDLKFSEIRERKVKPIHLVCTAANDLSGDHLGTLYRGAQSAVLSANGISINGQTARLDYLRLSAALTASAAAFNSQMGRVSMDLGWPVAFLMSALGLRLGLWVPHPKNPRRNDYLLPGRFFLCELLGLSRAGARQVHLSDGNHFENFGLYELIRRHCRYVIVSDCGADPSVTFDDLANVLRRVREDFGVEVEIDVDPLRSDEEGRARQHAVVGTIHYDGLNGIDKGTLIYFKPALTGDEPPDVLQYRSQSDSFPHETTGDQFYNEAQWESYRRLGQHAARQALGFCARAPHRTADFVDRLFLGAREHLQPAPTMPANISAASSDRAALEADLFSTGPEFLRREFFPEAAAWLKGEVGVDDERIAEEIKALGHIMRALEIMEDVWAGADLENAWSHPLNEGWMNYFERWASSPTFRRWWPILRPIYSNGFRDFVQRRFGVGAKDEQARPGERAGAVRLRLETERDLERFARGHAWRQFIQRQPEPDLRDLTVLAYRLELFDDAGESGASLDVGFLLADEARSGDFGWTARWSRSHLFVPPALVGAGIVGRQLDAVIAHYRRGRDDRDFGGLEVVIDGAPLETGERAAREQLVREIEFYKSRRFQPLQRDGRAQEIVLRRRYEPPS